MNAHYRLRTTIGSQAVSWLGVDVIVEVEVGGVAGVRSGTGALGLGVMSPGVGVAEAKSVAVGVGLAVCDAVGLGLGSSCPSR